MALSLQHRPPIGPPAIGRRAPAGGPGVLPVGAVAVAAAGAAMFAPPLVAIALALGVAVIAVGFRSPIAVAQLGVLSLAVSPQFALAEIAEPSLLLSAQKALVLAAFAPALVRYRVRVRFIWPIAVQALVAVVVVFLPGSFTGSGGDAIAAAAGAAVAWLALAVRWPSDAARRMLVTVAALPLASVVAGIVLELAGLSLLFRPEPSGVLRLQGASIPAHLAAMCLAGAFASVMLLRLGESRLALRGGAVSLVVVLLSLSRTDIAASSIILVPLVLAWIRLGASTTMISFKVWVTATAMAVGLALVAPPLLTRSGAQTEDSRFGIDDSGRTAAWALFYEDFERKPVLGHGPGSLDTLAWENGKARGNVFRAPHNEYLRLLVEGGLVFGGLLAAVMARALWLARNNVPRAMRGPVTALLVVVALGSIVENTFVTPQFMVPLTFALGAVLSVGLRRPEAPAAAGRSGSVVRS